MSKVNQQSVADPASILTKEKLKEIMDSKGPTVKAIVLNEDGTMEEVNYNSTPKDRHVEQFINGSPTIIGEYGEIQVILVKNIDSSNKALKLNKHKLKYPFDNIKVKGNIFLYRFNESCETVDFTLNEYKKYLETEPIKDNNDNNNDVNNKDDETVEDETIDIESMLTPIIKRQFKEKNGREPTEIELDNLLDMSCGMVNSGQMRAPCDTINEANEDENESEYEDDDGFIVDDENEAGIDENEMNKIKEMMKKLGKNKRNEFQNIIKNKYKTEFGIELNDEELKQAFKEWNLDTDNLNEADNEVDNEANNEADNKADNDGNETESEYENDGFIVDEENEVKIDKNEMEKVKEMMKQLGKNKRIELQNIIKDKYKNDFGIELNEKELNKAFKEWYLDGDNIDDDTVDKLNDVFIDNLTIKLKEYGSELERNKVVSLLQECGLLYDNSTELTAKEIKYLKSENAGDIILNNAKELIYNDLKSKAIKQWNKNNPGKSYNNNDINNIIKQLTLNIFDNIKPDNNDTIEDNNDDIKVDNNKENIKIEDPFTMDNNGKFDDESDNDSEYDPEKDTNQDVYNKDYEDDRNYDKYVHGFDMEFVKDSMCTRKQNNPLTKNINVNNINYDDKSDENDSDYDPNNAIDKAFLNNDFEDDTNFNKFVDPVVLE